MDARALPVDCGRSSAAKDAAELRCGGVGVLLAVAGRSAAGGGATRWSSGSGIPAGIDRAGTDHDVALCAFDAAAVSGARWGGATVSECAAGDVQWRGAEPGVAGALLRGAECAVAQLVWTNGR